MENQPAAAFDVGTHVVDLVQWTAFPDRALRAASITS
jgi:hypothetical protein